MRLLCLGKGPSGDLIPRRSRVRIPPPLSADGGGDSTIADGSKALYMRGFRRFSERVHRARVLRTRRPPDVKRKVGLNAPPATPTASRAPRPSARPAPGRCHDRRCQGSATHDRRGGPRVHRSPRERHGAQSARRSPTRGYLRRHLAPFFADRPMDPLEPGRSSATCTPNATRASRPRPARTT